MKVVKVEIRVPYVYYGRVTFECTQPSMTHQCFKEHCDINYILSRNPDINQVQHVNNAIPYYGDYSSVDEYRDSLDKIADLQEHFDSLPSKVRSRFDNDPEGFLEFVLDPKNKDEMLKMGLVEDKSVESSQNLSTAAQPENSA